MAMVGAVAMLPLAVVAGTELQAQPQLAQEALRPAEWP